MAGPLTGIVDFAVSFDGSTSEVRIPWNMLSGAAARTIEAWISTTNAGDGNPISWGVHATGQLSQIAFWASGLGFTECCGGGPGWTVPLATLNTADGAWHHVAITYDQVAILVYIDGVQYAPVGDPTNLPLTTGLSDLVFGSEPANGFYYKDNMTEVSIYSVALSATKIVAHYQARPGTGC